MINKTVHFISLLMLGIIPVLSSQSAEVNRQVLINDMIESPIQWKSSGIDSLAMQNLRSSDYGNAYQVLVSPGGDSYMTFYIKEKETFTTVGHNKVNFITEEDYSDQSIKIYKSTIIAGVIYENKWYEEVIKSKIQRAEESESIKRKALYNLIHWGYFSDNAVTMEQNFWNTGIFSKIEDLRQHPQWDSYGKNVWSRKEKALRPYIGMPVLVAKQLAEGRLDPYLSHLP